ncbi:MAG: Cytochrome c oxidase polypeptide II, partial [uncultured Actinomycetospora sp.]
APRRDAAPAPRRTRAPGPGPGRGHRRGRGDHLRVLGRRGAALRLARRRHARGRADAHPVDRGRDRRARRRCPGLGRHRLDRRVPPQEGRRVGPAAAVPVQPAARAGPDGHPAGHRRRALLLHRGRPERRGPQPDGQRARDQHHRVPVELGVHLPPDARAQRPAGLRRRHHEFRADPRAAHRPAHPLHPGVEGRHPLLLGAGVPVQARRLPVPRGERAEEHLGDRPHRAHRRVRRPLRRVLRRLPLDDELRGPRRAAGPLRPLPGAAPADQPPDRPALHHERGARGDELRRALQPAVDQYLRLQSRPAGPDRHSL